MPLMKRTLSCGLSASVPSNSVNRASVRITHLSCEIAGVLSNLIETVFLVFWKEIFLIITHLSCKIAGVLSNLTETVFLVFWKETKEKYRGMFETQKSRNKTSSGEIVLDIRTVASPKVGQDQVSGGVSVLWWHAEIFLITKLDTGSNKHRLNWPSKIEVSMDVRYLICR